MESWTDRAVKAGTSFGVGDLVTAVAHEAGALVWALDGGFERMERLRFVGLYAAGRTAWRAATRPHAIGCLLRVRLSSVHCQAREFPPPSQ